MDINISNYLAELTNSKGDDIAIAYRRNLRLARWSYARLISAIFQFAGELEARGVTKGDRVIICGENCPEWVIAFYACTLRGVVVVPLDTQSTPDFVARICEQVRPALFIRGMTSGGIAPALPTLILEEISGTIAGRPVRVKSNMAAVEASVDHDYLRFKSSFFFAQGDSNPTDNKATGFDAIFDDPNFVGGQFSFWNRNGIRLSQTGVGLVQPNSVLPSLRSSKIQGQANFVNPGILIYNAGVDAELTQRLKAVFNVNYLRFHRTESLEYLLFQNHIRHDIGWDYSLGVAYRLVLITNVTMTFGAATLKTGRGFRDIYIDQSQNCPPNVGDFCQPNVVNPSKILFSLFAELKLTF